MNPFKEIRALHEHIAKLQALVEVHEARLNDSQNRQYRTCQFCFLVLPQYTYPAEQHITSCHKLHCDCPQNLDQKCERLTIAKSHVFKEAKPQPLEWK